MRKLIIVTAIAVAAAVAAPAYATELTMDTVLGTTMDEVKAKLVEMGYEVRKSELEDGKIEVYFVNDDQMGEVYVNAETGKIIKVEMK